MNDLPTLRDTQKNCMARLHSYLLAMRGLTGDYSEAIESGTGSASFRIDAPGQADTGSDIGRCEGTKLNSASAINKGAKN